MRKPIFIAHRGAWSPGRRENTARAVERAVSSGRFNYIEVDVRKSRSDDEAVRTPILMHDDTLDRLYEAYRIPKSKRHRLGQNIEGLTIDIIRGEEIEVSTLSEGLKAANSHPIVIELKNKAALEPVVDVITQEMNKKSTTWTWEKIVFSSFDWAVLDEIHQKLPDAGIVVNYSFRTLHKNLIKKARQRDVRWIAANKWLAPVVSVVGKLYNLPHVYSYTVNTKIGVRLQQLSGVYGVYTDVVTLPDSFKSK